MINLALLACDTSSYYARRVTAIIREIFKIALKRHVVHNQWRCHHNEINVQMSSNIEKCKSHYMMGKTIQHTKLTKTKNAGEVIVQERP